MSIDINLCRIYETSIIFPEQGVFARDWPGVYLLGNSKPEYLEFLWFALGLNPPKNVMIIGRGDEQKYAEYAPNERSAYTAHLQPAIEIKRLKKAFE